ncbi:11004_t:CDS:1, partial [Racocetra persica]
VDTWVQRLPVESRLNFLDPSGLKEVYAIQQLDFRKSLDMCYTHQGLSKI